LKTYLESRDLDEKLIKKELGVIEKYRHWEVLGYTSKDELLQSEIGKKESEIDDLLEAKRAELAFDPMGGRGRKKVYNINNPKHKKGTSKSYLIRKIRKDRPDIFGKLEQYGSVHAAAIDAGIIKRMIQHEPTVEGFTRAISRHLSESEREELKGRI
jgi:hypothetical protein